MNSNLRFQVFIMYFEININVVSSTSVLRFKNSGSVCYKIQINVSLIGRGVGLVYGDSQFCGFHSWISHQIERYASLSEEVIVHFSSRKTDVYRCIVYTMYTLLLPCHKKKTYVHGSQSGELADFVF